MIGDKIIACASIRCIVAPRSVSIGLTVLRSSTMFRCIVIELRRSRTADLLIKDHLHKEEYALRGRDAHIVMALKKKTV
jgi:hypothetical protein